MGSIIKVDRSIIPACDVDRKRYEEIVRETRDIKQVGAYKIGAALALELGLPKVVEIARRHTDKPLIYDHQKAATDIPDTGKSFMRSVKQSGIDALIIFPLSGPATQTAWILSAKEAGLPLISGGHMTHERFLRSEGGYIDDEAVEKMFTNSAQHGIRDYVVPGNKPDVIEKVRKLLLTHKVEPIFYAPGFITQGGSVSAAAEAAGPWWHAIVGRALYEAPDIHRAALNLISCLSKN